MPLRCRLTGLGAAARDVRAEDEPTEAYLRRVAESRARGTMVFSEVKQALQEYFREADRPVSQADPVPPAEDQRPMGDLQLLLAEYSSLREESSQARQAQQQVFAWSLATFGVFFAGGLAVAGSGAARGPQGMTGLSFRAFTLVFGLALPGAITASSAAWLGELVRMERVNGYLRGLELLVAEHFQVAENPRMPGILRWETYLVTRVGHGRGINAKQVVGYLGGAALYFGAFLVSLLLFLTANQSHQFRKHTGLYHHAGWALSAIEAVVFLLCTLVPGSAIRKMPSAAPQKLEDFNPTPHG